MTKSMHSSEQHSFLPGFQLTYLYKIVCHSDLDSRSPGCAQMYFHTNTLRVTLSAVSYLRLRLLQF